MKQTTAKARSDECRYVKVLKYTTRWHSADEDLHSIDRKTNMFLLANLFLHQYQTLIVFDSYAHATRFCFHPFIAIKFITTSLGYQSGTKHHFRVNSSASDRPIEK